MINLNHNYIHTVTCYITLPSEQFEIMQDIISQRYDDEGGMSFGEENMYTMDDSETVVFTCSDEEEAESILIEIQNFLEECDE